MDEEYDDFLEIEVELDDQEDLKKKKKRKDDFIEIDAIERTIEFIEEEKEEVEAQTKRRRSTTGRGLTLINNTFDPSKILNLSLWLKADTGVSLQPPYNYASQIVIFGTSTPNFNGTYVANSVPENIDGELQSYNFDSPEGNPTRRLRWDASYPAFILDTNDDVGFSSTDGITWDPFNQSITQVVVSGFTGIYANANGTYNYTSEYEALLNGDYLIEGGVIKYLPTQEEIAINNNANYSGAWTPATYLSTITLSNAGTTSVNGVYTRTDSQIEMEFVGFTASGGRSILYDDNEGFWYTSPNDNYRNFNNTPSGPWQTENGDAPAPTAVYANSSRNVGSPTTTSFGLTPSGSVSGSVTTSTVTPNTVVAWEDQSGNGFNAETNSEALPQYLLIGGKSFISFASNINMLIAPIWNNVQFVGTIFVVGRFASSSAGGTAKLLSQEGIDGNFLFSRGYNSTNSFAITTDEIDVVSSLTNADNNTNYILGATFGESNIATVYLNGVSNGTGGVTNNTGTINTLIGGGEESSNIAEMVLYNRVLTTQERLQVETYLNQKYQIY